MLLLFALSVLNLVGGFRNRLGGVQCVGVFLSWDGGAPRLIRSVSQRGGGRLVDLRTPGAVLRNRCGVVGNDEREPSKHTAYAHLPPDVKLSHTWTPG